MKNGTISVYNEGVTWLVGLSAAAVGGAFLHYDALGGAPWYARLLFVLVTLLFLASVGIGVHYAFWLYHVFNQQEREQKLLDESRSEQGPADALEYYRQLETIKKKIDEARAELEKLHKYLLWSFSLGILGAAIILALVAFTAKAPPTKASQNSFKADCSQLTVHLSDQLEKTITARMTSDPAPPGTPSRSSDGTPGIDPQLQQALLQHLRAPQPNSRTAWIILLVVGILAAGSLIAWVAVRKPEASPLSVAVTIFGTITALILKLAAEKPTLPSSQFPLWIVAISGTLVLSGIALIILAIVKLSAREKHRLLVDTVPAATHSSEDECNERNRQGLLAVSLLVYGFSAVVLALVPALLFHGQSVAVATKQCPQCPVLPTGQITVSSLPGINNLGDGRRSADETIDPSRIQKLINDARAHEAYAGDILLLLGSADCISPKPKTRGGRWNNNEELAAARAGWVENGLQGKLELSGIRVESGPLPQHSGCRETHDVRAVYPFLIHGTQSQPATVRP